MFRIRPHALAAPLSAAALLLAFAGSALAHAFPTTTVPPVGSTLKTAPQEVVINFTEGVIPNFTSIDVVNASGARVDKNDGHLGPAGEKQFVVDLGPLTAGTYKVIWHATAVDTHKTEGSFNFTLAP
jgi:copper resistance protein C